MNYRHAFHAGNFADVFKHALLCRILLYLQQKDSAVRVIDTHAGAGIYDLASEQAGRTQEADVGILRLQAETLQADAAELLRPYLAIVAAVQKPNRLGYPGSPEIIARLLRTQDRATFNELHPEDSARLARRYREDKRITLRAGDAWQAWKALVPPVERRGLVLVDPPFEQPREFERLATGLRDAHRRWATGISALWYPIKARRDVNDFKRFLAEQALAPTLCLELLTDRQAPVGALAGCGLIVVNPPWTLLAEAQRILPCLAKVLGQSRRSGWEAFYLVAER
jgi:23S rRNA (adenine2030-N6)-methyltransferase